MTINKNEKLPNVLVVDDDAHVVSWLLDSLPEEGFVAVGETSAERALAQLAETRFDLVVSDVEMPEMRGTEFVRRVHAIRKDQSVVLITAFGSIDLAMESVRAGAVDFLTKPFRIEALVLALQRALREHQMRREIHRLRSAVQVDAPFGAASKSVTMQRALDIAMRAARSDLPVLITGESGVGKGALARFIHQQSSRHKSKFLPINCAALPLSLAEAELFGVRRGAFTDAREDRAGVFEQAHNGTLFLDEIGELSPELQPKLLQVLEASVVRPLGAKHDVAANVRIVAATNRPLEEALRERRFRPDLYHRLNVVRVEIPPLRERSEDIEAIVEQALGNISKRMERVAFAMHEDALRFLRAQAWPGNVRELINALERAAALSDHDVLTRADFHFLEEANTYASPAHDPAWMQKAVAEEWSLAKLEREYIRRILEKTGGHKSKAAEILGLDRRTLYRKAAELAHDEDEG